MTLYDARVGAWVGAFNRLEAANKLLRKYPGLKDTEVLNQHNALIHQASVYADLALASADVGMVAGEWLREETICEEASAQVKERFMEEDTNGGS